MKDKWFGKCNICDKETKLMSTRLTLDVGITYWIKRSCDDCIHTMIESINDTLDILQKKEEIK